MVFDFPQNINEHEVPNIFLTVFLQCGATCDIHQKKSFAIFYESVLTVFVIVKACSSIYIYYYVTGIA
jgi:hypothetical protein